MKVKNVTKGICILALGLISVPCSAADVGFGVNINIGNTPPPPVYAPPPVYVPPPVRFDAPPMFIIPPSLGISIAVGLPYDMFMVSGNYYVFKGNQWYFGPQYSGPWRTVSYGKLPHQLRKYDIQQYRRLRDREYQSYNRDRDHYRGRYYQAPHEGGERHRESAQKGEQERRNEGRREDQGRNEGQRHGEGQGRGERHDDGQGRGERHGRD